MRVGQTYVDTFVLSVNQLSSYIDGGPSSVLFTMHPPLSPKFSVIYTPESGEVRKVIYHFWYDDELCAYCRGLLGQICRGQSTAYLAHDNRSRRYNWHWTSSNAIAHVHHATSHLGNFAPDWFWWVNLRLSKRGWWRNFRNRLPRHCKLEL